MLLPNDSALLPPLCIWRMKKIQKPMSSRIGAHEYSGVAHGLAVGSLALMRTPFSHSLLARPSNCAGRVVWNVSFDLRTPLISLPVIVTLETCPASTCDMNVLKLMACSRDWNVLEKFHTRSADEHEHHPEQQTFQSRIHCGPPHCRVSLKTTTPSVASRSPGHLVQCVSGHPHHMVVPVHDQRQPVPLARGTLRSTKRSCSFFVRRARPAAVRPPDASCATEKPSVA